MRCVALICALLLPTASYGQDGDGREEVQQDAKGRDAALDVRAAAAEGDPAGDKAEPDGASADVPMPAVDLGDASEGAADSTDAARPTTLEERLQRMEEENERLQRRIDKLARDRVEVPHLSLSDDVRIRLRGYGDVGAFYAFGDVAYVRDSGKRASGDIESFPWLLYPHVLFRF